MLAGVHSFRYIHEVEQHWARRVLGFEVYVMLAWAKILMLPRGETYLTLH